MTTVVVAEKPSVARDLARLLGAGQRREGWLEGNGYQVTWALGHLVAFAEPDDYGPDWAGRWALTQLPMIPARWKLRVLPKTAAQFNVVKGLLNAADTESVICATDAGREGELIFRLIAEHARCRRPVRRLWVSSLTDDAIRAGLARLRPAADYDALGAAARARAQADWLMGMNLTRAYTVHNRVLCTIGRVQTPTLAMICARDAAIEGFTRTFYYELVAHLRTPRQAPFDALWVRVPRSPPAGSAAPDGRPSAPADAPPEPVSETRIATRAEAERLQQALAPQATGTVTAVEQRRRRHRPPPLYDLTSLQRDANRRFGFTAARTLELAQELYETRKLITYPRTECRHISEDMLPQLPGILQVLDHPLAPTALARLEAGHRLGRAWVDRTKLTDHHAILPTAHPPPSGLTGPARQLYDLIVARFVAVFLPDAEVEETRVVVDIGGETFVARGSRVLEPGWRRAELPRSRRGGGGAGPDATATTAHEAASGPTLASVPGAALGPDADDRVLPPVSQGETVAVDGLEVLEKETEPPRPYDDASLLAAMRNAGREIEDDALAAAMKDSGLGTPATRAEIIEKLIRTGYVERQRKQLRATPKGRALIPLVAEPLRSPVTTAAWEQRLKDIEEGRAAAEDFYRDICALINDLITRVAAGPAMAAEAVAAARGVVSAKHGRSGGRGRARASAGPAAGGAAGDAGAETVPDPGAAADGEAGRGSGAGARQRKATGGLQRRRSGQGGGGRRGAGPAGAGPGEGLGPCPICGQGEVTANAHAYGCSRFREGCGLTIWKTIAGHAVTDAEARMLLSGQITGPLEDLQSRAGKPFRAWLTLDPMGKVVFSFSAPEGTEAAAPVPPAAPAPSRSGRGQVEAGSGTRAEIASEVVAAPDEVAGTTLPRPGRRRTGGTAPTAGQADDAGRLGPPLPAAEARPLAPAVSGSSALERDPIPCPSCGQGRLIQGRRGFGCSRWREGCGFVIWQEIAGHRLSLTDLRRLVADGRLGPLPDLLDTDGRPCTGSLWLSPAAGVLVDFEAPEARPPG